MLVAHFFLVELNDLENGKISIMKLMEKTQQNIKNYIKSIKQKYKTVQEYLESPDKYLVWQNTKEMTPITGQLYKFRALNASKSILMKMRPVFLYMKEYNDRALRRTFVNVIPTKTGKVLAYICANSSIPLIGYHYLMKSNLMTRVLEGSSKTLIIDFRTEEEKKLQKLEEEIKNES